MTAKPVLTIEPSVGVPSRLGGLARLMHELLHGAQVPAGVAPAPRPEPASPSDGDPLWWSIADGQRWRIERQQTPPWADRSATQALYVKARRLSQETGVPHHVDHVIPLMGKLVSGLHVHTNLRVISARDNVAKGNRFNP